MPSLHVGFAVAIGIALAAAFRHRGRQGARAAVGPDDRPRRRATGNHFVFDIAAGVVAAALGYRPRHGAVAAGGAPGPGLRPAFADA